MSAKYEIDIYGGAHGIMPKDAVEANAIMNFASQLRPNEQKQIVHAFEAGSYEMATNFVLMKTLTQLKHELGSLGNTFLAEVLNRQGISDNDNITEAITDAEAIRLAHDLGVISSSDALRLRQAYELVSHFTQGLPLEDGEEMGKLDAAQVLFSCVQGVLSKKHIEVSRRFVDFRNDLESKAFADTDPACAELAASPYFYRRLALSVLLSGIRSYSGAKLEHCLANLNLFLPLLWTHLKDAEKWQVGKTYAQVYSEGQKTQTAGIKNALVKVKGFDFVPESLRSQTFISAAEAVIRAHEGLNNFYNEPKPMSYLASLGSSLPPPALGICITAILCVKLGNYYGVCWDAESIAGNMLAQISVERMKHYMEHYLSGDIRILRKLTEDKPCRQWLSLFSTHPFINIESNAAKISQIIKYSKQGSMIKINQCANEMLRNYYSTK